MSEYVPGHMTDEQALETLKSMKLTMGRGSAKTMFQQGLLEAICHAVVALEDKVENKGEWVRKEDIIHYIATQYSEHNELVPIWLNIGDLKGEE